MGDIYTILCNSIWWRNLWDTAYGSSVRGLVPLTGIFDVLVRLIERQMRTSS